MIIDRMVRIDRIQHNFMVSTPFHPGLIEHRQTPSRYICTDGGRIRNANLNELDIKLRRPKFLKIDTKTD